MSLLMRDSGPLVLTWSAIAAFGVVCVIVGVTISSIVYGAGSTPYYVVILVGLLLTVPMFLNDSRRRDIFFGACVLASVPILLLVLQLLFLDPIQADPELLPTLALSVIVIVVGASAVLPQADFEKSMVLIAVGHMLICLYGILNWDLMVAQSVEVRFSALGVHTAVWGEIALGMLVAAVFANSRGLIFASTCVAAVVIYATQMRGAGVSAFVLVCIYFLLSAKYRLAPGAILGAVSIAVVALAFVGIEPMLDSIRNLLLWDDPHRGISSGLSGRFDNWREGFEIFLASPIIGSGVGSGGYTHNGYLKMLAQFGLFFGLIFWALFGLAAFRAWNRGSASLIAVLVAYALFLVTSPRYLNFQIMPLLGVVAVALAIVGRSRSASTRVRQTLTYAGD